MAGTNATVQLTIDTADINASGVVPYGGNAHSWPADEPAGRILGISCRRGRNSELDRFDTGDCSVVLLNQDARYSADDPASAYYGLLSPGRAVRVRTTVSGTQYDLWTGVIEACPPAWDYAGKRAIVNLKAAGMFTLLNAADAVAAPLVGLPAEAANTRANRYSAAGAGWPGALTLDYSTNTFPATTIAAGDYSGSLLSLMQDLELAEGGQLFETAVGGIAFWARQYRWQRVRSTTPVLTFSDAADGVTTYGYTGLSPDWDDSKTWNDVTITAAGVDSRATAPYQIRKYGQRRYSTQTVMASSSDAAAYAAWLADQYGDPLLRYPAITIDMQAPTRPSVAFMLGAGPSGSGREGNLWASAGLEIGDCVRVVRTPPGGSVAVTRDCFVEGISWEIQLGTILSGVAAPLFTCTLSLSPIPSRYWTLDDATYGVLGSTTKVGY